MESDRGQEAVINGGIRSSNVAVAGFEHERSFLGVIQIEGGDSLQFEDRREEHLNAGPVRNLGRIAAVAVVFHLGIGAEHGVELEVGVNFGQKLKVRVLRSGKERGAKTKRYRQA